MFNHDLLPNAENWATGEAQRYGWRYLANTSGAYGTYGCALVDRGSKAAEDTIKKVAAIRDRIINDGCIVLGSEVILAVDVVTANAMKPDGQICSDDELINQSRKVGIYTLMPSVEINSDL